MTDFDDSFLEETISAALGDEENYHVPMGIARYDYANSHGWWVRIRREEAPFQKMFWDSHYPSIAEALKAAIKYRHEIISSFPLEKTMKGRNFKTLSGNPEERIYRRTDKGRKRPYEYWQANWYDENHVHKKKNFSVGTHGEEVARELALEYSIKNHNPKPKPIKPMAATDPYAKQKFKAVSREDVAVLATVNSSAYRNRTKEEIQAEESYPRAFEGGEVLQLHKSVERDKNLRNAKVQQFLEENGAIYCEVCGLQFTQRYPFLEHDIIEVHHIVPLSQLSKKTEITFKDLMLLCPNCHTAVHQGDEETYLLMAMEHFEHSNDKTTNKALQSTPKNGATEL